jgi:hypothetical protein
VSRAAAVGSGQVGRLVGCWRGAVVVDTPSDSVAAGAAIAGSGCIFCVCAVTLACISVYCVGTACHIFQQPPSRLYHPVINPPP